jgi:hypothetical protein
MGKRVLFFLLLFAPSQMIAAVVTSGFVEWSYSGGSVFNMEMEGPRLSAHGTIYTWDSNWPGWRCGPCEPGTLIDATAAVSGDDLIGVIGAFRFQPADRILITGPGRFDGAFDFWGLMCMQTSATPADPPICVSYEQLTGRGNILLDVFQYPEGSLQIERARYTFAVPEPSTYVLVPPCLVLLAGWHLSRTRTLLSRLRAGERSGQLRSLA